MQVNTEVVYFVGPLPQQETPKSGTGAMPAEGQKPD